MQLIHKKISKKNMICVQSWTQWGFISNFFTKKFEYNWIDITPIELTIEYSSYKGSSFEIRIVLLGFGIAIEIYDFETRQSFINELLKDIPELQ